MDRRLLNLAFVLFLIFSALIPNITHVNAAPASGNITTPEEMGTFLDAIIAEQMKTNHIPGVVVTVVKDGQVFFTKGYGYSNVIDQIPVNPTQTLFRIGSVTKLFTATAVMQLVEQGKLNLDTDINTYLDFKIPSTFPTPITLKNLLTHTSGFEESNIGLIVDNPEQLTSLGNFLKTHIPARVFPPGEVAAYSNYGASLAGYIVERVSGLSLSDYMEKNIFLPLNMNHSTLRQPLLADLGKNLAIGYNFINNQYVKGEFEIVQGSPAGAISATADDMAKFMIAQLQKGRYNEIRILSEATAELMQSPHPYNPSLEDTMAYGFVWNHINGQLDLWHNGATFLFHSGLHLLPEQNLGFFISANAPGASDLEAIIFQDFMDRYYPAQPDESPTPLANMNSRKGLYEGEYFSSRSNFTGVEKIINLLSPMNVSVSPDGYVLFSSGGTVRKYVEVEPGILVSVLNPWQRIVSKVDQTGQAYLLTGVGAYIKAAWYQTTTFHLIVVGLSLLVLLSTLIGWVIASIVRVIKKALPLSRLSRYAQANGAFFILLLIAFLIMFVVVLSDTSLAYGVPRFILEVPTGLPYLLILPFFMVAAAVGMLVFAISAMVKRLWNLRGRLHYLLITVAAWAMVWELVFWNFLKIYF